MGIAARPVHAERAFFLGITAALLATVFVGFAPSFFLRPWFLPEVAATTPTETLFYVHGGFFAAWFALLIVQASLVTSRRVAVHRKVGWIGAALACAMLVLGTYGAIVAARRGFVGIDVPGRAFLAIPLVDMALFALFVGLAIARRTEPQTHKRLMLLASISLLAAAIVRWPFELVKAPPAFFGFTDLFVVAIVAWDLATLRRVHPVTLWGGLLLLASQPFRLWLSGTDGWMRFASWLVG